MAKWDLSKLPEGRKPLPDEWFAERAQMQDRIKELEVKLAKALDFIQDLTVCEWPYDEDAKRILAELTGSKDE